jgi:hypothetical protein
MVAEKLKLLCKANSAMAVYLDYRQAQNKTVVLPHESTRKKPSKYTNRDLKHEKGDEPERKREGVCVCVCVREREREREREKGRDAGREGRQVPTIL